MAEIKYEVYGTAAGHTSQHKQLDDLGTFPDLEAAKKRVKESIDEFPFAPKYMEYDIFAVKTTRKLLKTITVKEKRK